MHLHIQAQLSSCYAECHMQAATISPLEGRRAAKCSNQELLADCAAAHAAGGASLFTYVAPAGLLA